MCFNSSASVCGPATVVARFGKDALRATAVTNPHSFARVDWSRPPVPCLHVRWILRVSEGCGSGCGRIPYLCPCSVPSGPVAQCCGYMWMTNEGSCSLGIGYTVERKLNRFLIPT